MAQQEKPSQEELREMIKAYQKHRRAPFMEMVEAVKPGFEDTQSVWFDVETILETVGIDYQKVKDAGLLNTEIKGTRVYFAEYIKGEFQGRLTLVFYPSKRVPGDGTLTDNMDFESSNKNNVGLENGGGIGGINGGQICPPNC